MSCVHKIARNLINVGNSCTVWGLFYLFLTSSKKMCAEFYYRVSTPKTDISSQLSVSWRLSNADGPLPTTVSSVLRKSKFSDMYIYTQTRAFFFLYQE